QRKHHLHRPPPHHHLHAARRHAAAPEHDRARDQRHRPGRPDAHRRQRRLERQPDRLHLPVAVRSRARRPLHRPHRRRQRLLHAGHRRQRPLPARHRHRNEQRRPDRRRLEHRRPDRSRPRRDGDVSLRAATSAGYPPTGTPGFYTAGTVVTAGKRNVFSSYQILDALLRFDTSSLPDNAVISSASLSFNIPAKANADSRNLIGSWYDAANWPIDGNDWAADVGTTALPGSPLANLPLAGTGTATLSLQNPAQISTTGSTCLRLGLSGGAPTGDNFVQIASNENTTYTAPRLTITYTLPGGTPPPQNTTAPAI